MNRGSIELARRLCYEIAGPTDEEDDMEGTGYGSVDVAEILSAEVLRLREVIARPPATASPEARHGTINVLGMPWYWAD